MFYEAVFRELYKEKIEYLVVGGVAINLYGILRATALKKREELDDHGQ